MNNYTENKVNKYYKVREMYFFNFVNAFAT